MPARLPSVLLLLGLSVAAALAAPAPEQRPAMIRVPAGELIVGADDGDPDERPRRTVRIATAFSIDRDEVTQAAYAACVAAGACARRLHYPDSEGPTLPAVGVTWFDADRYCRWAGRRLPTELEWERAARGTDGRTYPWGAGLECGRANFGSFAGDGPCAGRNPARVLPVGSRPLGRSPVGANDMSGNAWEWVGPLPPPFTAAVVRGGSCCSFFAMPTTTNRIAFPPTYADRDIGFRCAAGPGPSPI